MDSAAIPEDTRSLVGHESANSTAQTFDNPWFVAAIVCGMGPKVVPKQRRYRPAIVAATHELDGSGSALHDDRMVALDEARMTAQQVHQLLSTPDPAADHRPGDGRAALR